VAIGEIGLDYHYDFAPRDVQREVFAAQIALALRARLPVIIHTREATDDTIAVLKEAGRAASAASCTASGHRRRGAVRRSTSASTSRSPAS
jgi:Tat protein secretion system quality control protein TatD with DNase activity